jgi:hypothetical protein
MLIGVHALDLVPKKAGTAAGVGIDVKQRCEKVEFSPGDSIRIKCAAN